MPLRTLRVIKGSDPPQNEVKHVTLAQRVEAVNMHGGFGTWAASVSVGGATGMQEVAAKHS